MTLPHREGSQLAWSLPRGLLHTPESGQQAWSSTLGPRGSDLSALSARSPLLTLLQCTTPSTLSSAQVDHSVLSGMKGKCSFRCQWTLSVW